MATSCCVLQSFLMQCLLFSLKHPCHGKRRVSLDPVLSESVEEVSGGGDAAKVSKMQQGTSTHGGLETKLLANVIEELEKSIQIVEGQSAVSAEEEAAEVSNKQLAEAKLVADKLQKISEIIQGLSSKSAGLAESESVLVDAVRELRSSRQLMKGLASKSAVMAASAGQQAQRTDTVREILYILRHIGKDMTKWLERISRDVETIKSHQS